ncbi:MAG: outer membrane lipoprotein LolB [Cycloclasticus sp.]|nr:outer membrane lipoprotein LolB [Cycloclasticus sp.]
MLVVTQLFACAAIEPKKSDIVSKKDFGDVEEILAVKSWRLLGRISVRNRYESWLTKLDWNHDETVDALVLSTSLGGVVAKLEYGQQGIKLSDADGVVRQVSENELQSLLGYSPPLRYLRFWVRGIPAPFSSAEIVGSGIENILMFEQDGWQVKLQRFNRVNELVLPKKLTLSKGGLKIILIIDEWLT